MVETQTKVASKTYAMVAVTVLAAGGAAYAAMGLLGGQRGYQNFYVQCHDGSVMEHSANLGRTQLAGSREGFGPGSPCMTAKQLSELATNFCVGRVNPATGKSGVNTYKISQRCIVQTVPSYGYGYNDPGYGYNQAVAPAKETVSKKTTTINTKKKSIFNFWKK